MTSIIDVSYPCGDQAAYLAGAGVKTVIRYYSRDTHRPSKRLSLAEARQLASSGLRIGIVHEAFAGNQAGSFTQNSGLLDGTYAREYGARTICQPGGSAIYFAVDTDVTRTQVQSGVLPFFRGVAQAMAAANGLATYRVGVYGSGLVCNAVHAAGLAELTWLAQATGWSQSTQYDASGAWSMKQLMPARIGDVGCDPDVAGTSGDIGDFMLTAASAGTPAATSTSMTVTARNGLRLRAGPGVEYDILGLLPFGSRISVLKKVGDWAQVDREGDGATDGFASTHYLA